MTADNKFDLDSLADGWAVCIFGRGLARRVRKHISNLELASQSLKDESERLLAANRALEERLAEAREAGEGHRKALAETSASLEETLSHLDVLDERDRQHVAARERWRQEASRLAARVEELEADLARRRAAQEEVRGWFDDLAGWSAERIKCFGESR
jgi:chromosome segregation ATPase